MTVVGFHPSPSMVQQKETAKESTLHFNGTSSILPELGDVLVTNNTAGPSTESVGIKFRIPIGKVSSVKTELEHPPFVGKQLEDDMAISIYLSLFTGKVYLETPFGSQRFGTSRHCQCWHNFCGDLTWSMVQPHVGGQKFFFLTLDI